MTASGVELPCSAPIVQMTAFGATSPFACVPTKD